MAFKVKLVYIIKDPKSYNVSPGYYAIPLALLALKKYMEARLDPSLDISMEIETFFMEEKISEVLGKIDAKNADVVAFSSYVWNIERTLKIAGRIRKANKDAVIMLGGPEIEETESLMAENPFVDVCVRGEGEELFHAIITSLAGGGGIPELPGLTFRSGGKIICCKGKGLVRDINTLPSLYTDDFFEKYPWPSLIYETSKGCFNKCKYCPMGVKLRYKDMDLVEKELKAILAREKIELVEIIDGELSLDPERLKQILRIIKKYRNHDVTFLGYFGFVNYDDELLDLLNEIGFHMHSGIQTSNPSALKYLGRSPVYDHKKREAKFRKVFKRVNVDNCEFSVIVGLPGDTYETFGETLKWCQSMGVRNVHTPRLHVLPGTVFRINAEKYGIEYRKKPYYTINKSGTFSRADMLRASSSLLWFASIYYGLSGEKLLRLSEQGVFVWDVIQSFPYMDAKKQDYFYENRDEGLYIVKRSMLSEMSDLTCLIMKNLSKRSREAAILLEVMEEGFSDGKSRYNNGPAGART